MTIEVLAGLIGEEASKEPLGTILAVPFLMPSTRLVYISCQRMNLFSNIVALLIAL